MPTTFKRAACQNKLRLTKATFLAFFDEDSEQRVLFDRIGEDRWDIVSFDPDEGEVCIVFYDQAGNELSTSSFLVKSYVFV